jgi:hypothetical protein
VGSGDSAFHSPAAGQARGMNTKPRKRPHLPGGVAVTKADVDHQLSKTKTVSMRVSPAEHASMTAAASALGMPLTAYLVRCSELVARRLPAAQHKR